ncbi:MAG: hypothetical protein IK132_07560 [Clostridia bacterium]|nr:hypothetical protein [Clostridia bacterium]
MKKILEHLPIYFIYVVAASYLGLLVMVILNIPVKFITANEAVRSLLFSLTMELAACAALFVLFRVAGNKYSRDNIVRIGEELPVMILAQVGNILLNIVFRLKLPGSLHVKYFINFLNSETVIDAWSAHKTAVLLLYLLFSAIGLIFCILGYISGAKKRIAERAELTGK